MKLPVQAPAVVRGSLSWPLRWPDRRGGTAPAIEPAAGGVVNCTDPTPNSCLCDNGVATCCPTTAGKSTSLAILTSLAVSCTSTVNPFESSASPRKDSTEQRRTSVRRSEFRIDSRPRWQDRTTIS